MQDRYVGDVGDFAKYALLRGLAGAPGEEPIRLGVVWCLFPNESHNKDGRHVSYLRRSEFADLDSELHRALSDIVNLGQRRISAITNGGILPPGTVFCDAVVVPSKARREI